MAFQDEAVVQEMLKYTYNKDRLEAIIFDAVPLWSRLKKNSTAQGGRRGQLITPFVIAYPEGWSGSTPGGPIAEGTDAKTIEATFELVEFTGRISVPWKLVSDSRTDKMAFEQIIAFLDRHYRTAILQDIDWQLLSNGLGELGVLTQTETTDTVQTAGVPRLRPGQVVDLIDADDFDTPINVGLTVLSVDPLTRTVVFDAAIAGGSAIGDFFVDTGTVTSTTSLNMFGIEAVINDANPDAAVGLYGNIDRDTPDGQFWQSPVLTSGTNRPLVGEIFVQAEDAVTLKGGGEVDEWLMNQGVHRAYFGSLTEVRYIDAGMGGGMKGDLGMAGGPPKEGNEMRSSLSGDDKPICVHPYATQNTMYGMNYKTLCIGHGSNATPMPAGDIAGIGVPTVQQSFDSTGRKISALDIPWAWWGQLASKDVGPAGNVRVEALEEAA